MKSLLDQQTKSQATQAQMLLDQATAQSSKACGATPCDLAASEASPTEAIGTVFLKVILVEIWYSKLYYSDVLCFFCKMFVDYCFVDVANLSKGGSKFVEDFGTKWNEDRDLQTRKHPNRNNIDHVKKTMSRSSGCHSLWISGPIYLGDALRKFFFPCWLQIASSNILNDSLKHHLFEQVHHNIITFSIFFIIKSIHKDKKQQNSLGFVVEKNIIFCPSR